MIDYIDGDATVWEQEPLKAPRAPTASSRSTTTSGFWQNMDTLRDKHVLQEMWESGNAPWKVWDRPPAAAPRAAAAR